MRESRENRAERLSDRAAAKRQESERAYNSAREMASTIPFGQPILVGHYSEKRDRNFRNRITSKFGQAFELSDEAKDLERRAAAAERNDAIYADDADPVAKLDEKIKGLRELQEAMKKANEYVRKIIAGKDAEENRKALIALVGEGEASGLLEKDWCGRYGFASYQLSNNNANIRRLELRKKSLEVLKSSDRKERTAGDVRIVEDPELARIQLFFPGKPPEETRSTLKRNGFRWAPSVGAWQRQLNNAGRYAAERALKEIGKEV